MVSFTAAVPLANAILTACIQAMSPRMSHYRQEKQLLYEFREMESTYL